MEIKKLLILTVSLFTIFYLIYFATNIYQKTEEVKINKTEEIKEIRKGIYNDFENGNLGSFTEDPLNTFTLNFGPGAGKIWFYFKLVGEKNQNYTFILKDVRGDHWKENTKIVASYDKVNWQQIQGNLYNPRSGECGWTKICYDYKWTFTPKQDEVYFAFFYPYTNWQLDQLLETYKNNPNLKVENIGTTLLGPEQKMLTITDNSVSDINKKVVWLIAREDQWETLSSYYMSGEIKYLLSDDPLAAKLRKNIIFKIIPLVSISAAVKGTILGMKDNNSDNIVYLTGTWMENPSPEEIENIKNQIINWKNEGKKIDIAGRFHSWAWQSPTYFYGSNQKLRDSASKILQDNIKIDIETIEKGRMGEFINNLYDDNITIFAWEAGADKTTIENAEYTGSLTMKIIADYFGIK